MIKIPHEKFCVLPWISLETGPIGTLRPCCLFEGEISDAQGRKYELDTCDFQSVRNSEYLQNLRREFLQGQEPSGCRRCWSEEDSGRTSKRLHTLDRLKHIVSHEFWDTDPKPLVFLDLKLGNICNLKCRICGSWSSSTFAAEELQFIPPGQDRKSNHNYLMLKKGAWPRNNRNFWSELETISDDIRYLEFTGGEPFMIQEHFDLLQGLISRGISHHIEIHYNTNGTQRPLQAVDIWKKFKHVEIAFSIDDVEERFEYQRSNAHWDLVRENLRWFQDLRACCTNIQLQICSTVNIFNVFYLENLSHWIDGQGFDFVYWNMLHDPSALCIARLPLHVKHRVRSRLESAKVSSRHRDEFGKIVDFMMSGPDSDGQDMLERIAYLDFKRNQDLGSAHPEWAEIIGYQRSS